MRKEYWMIVNPDQDAMEIAQDLLMPSDETIKNGYPHEVSLGQVFLSEAAAQEALSEIISRQERYLKTLTNKTNVTESEAEMEKYKKSRIVKLVLSLAVEE
jgi:hypothetical protein